MSCFPIALFNKTAATDESTPPESPKITLSSEILFLISFIDDSTNDAGVHEAEIFAIFIKKFYKKTNLKS